MEGLTRLVSESLARHGFDRPLDYRRLRWSRWFRCESHHSLLVVPSKPGVFALAEEIMGFGNNSGVEERPFSATSGGQLNAALAAPEAGSQKPEADPSRRMLAVTQFFEDDDMAFVLDRMLSRQNPMAARLASGRYFVRFVVIDDQTQRRSICNALNQWMVSAAEKATGIGSHFASSLELTPATEYIPQPDDSQQSLFPDSRVRPAEQSSAKPMWDRVSDAVGQDFAGTPTFQRPAEKTGITPASAATAPHLDSGAATNIHCPSPFPSGF
jgi:hypothetical protein